MIDTDDGAQLFVETTGLGRDVVLVHGWTMSRRFWKRQVKGLSADHRIIVMDLRAHGDSSKTPQGHNVPQYARDVRAVIEALDVKHAVLAGWSLAGPVVLDYWTRYGADRVAGLALVEMTPAPMSSEPWNTHARNGYDFDGLNALLLDLEQDRRSFGERFIHSMFCRGAAGPRDLDWMRTEVLKTPLYASTAIYSDYVLRDYTNVLKTITVPALALYGRSPHLCFGRPMGRIRCGNHPPTRIWRSSKRAATCRSTRRPDTFNEALRGFSEGL